MLACAAAGSFALGCGGKNDNVKGGVEAFNASDARPSLQETLQKGGGLSFCRIAAQPNEKGTLILTAVMKDGEWLQATIQPAEFRVDRVTTGAGFAHQFGAQAAQLRRNGEACLVSPSDGAVSLR